MPCEACLFAPMFDNLTDTLLTQVNTWAQAQLTNNDMLVAVVGGFVMTTLWFSLRGIFRSSARVLHGRFSSRLTVNSSWQFYNEFSVFLSQKVLKKGLTRTFTTVNRYADNLDDALAHGVVAPGYGYHAGFYKGRLVIVNRAQVESDFQFLETLTVTMIGWRTHFPSLLEDAVRNFFNGQPSVFEFRGSWTKATPLPRRTGSTLHVGDRFQKAADAVATFRKSRPIYEAAEMPYHLGILLTGRPGTGKSSFALALANSAGLHIARLNLDSLQNAHQLEYAVSSLPNNSMLLIEDIDSYGGVVAMASRGGPVGAPQEASKLSMGTLLNCLDGLATPDGMIVLATTNHPEKLDPAVLRRGRFDIQLHLDYLDYAALQAMALRLLGTELPEIEGYQPMSPADAQHLLRSAASAAEAAQAIRDVATAKANVLSIAA